VIPSDVSERLWLHAAAVVAAAPVPSGERDELTEELFGHLAERWRSLVDAGMEPSPAARRAISDFGSAERIGLDLTRTYRGRFWASTVGTLLPAARPAGMRTGPGIAAITTALFVIGSLTIVGAFDALVGLSPLKAVIQGTVWASGGAVLLLASRAAWRGQRWAVIAGVVMCAFSVIDGAASVMAGESLIPVSAIGSALALAIAGLDHDGVMRATRLGSEPRRIAVAGAAAILVASLASGPIIAAVSDPTVASDENLDFEVRVRCDSTPNRELDAEVLRWTVDVFWEWTKTSVLPGGVRGWERDTDMLVLRYPGDNWVLADTRPPEEAQSRRPVGWQGGGAPAEGAIPAELERPIVDFAILTRDTIPSVRYQAAWVMQSQLSTRDWPDAAEAWYFHGDRWSLVARAGCGQTGKGTPAD
jgi:hypothetical protein